MIPKDNADSLTKLPQEVAAEMKVHLVDRLDEAVAIALVTKEDGGDRAR